MTCRKELMLELAVFTPDERLLILELVRVAVFEESYNGQRQSVLDKLLSVLDKIEDRKEIENV